jgi:hypothetical protein
MIILLLLSLGIMHGLYADVAKEQAGGSEFVVQQPVSKNKSLSKNELKEHIGREIKTTFEYTTLIGQRLGQTQCLLSSFQQHTVKSDSVVASAQSLLSVSAQCNNVLGKMQKELSLLQQKCSGVVEKIIDNEAPFKKASRGNLDKSLTVIIDAHKQLVETTNKLQKLERDLSMDASSKQSDYNKINSISSVLKEQEKVIRVICASFAQDECLKGI